MGASEDEARELLAKALSEMAPLRLQRAIAFAEGLLVQERAAKTASAPARKVRRRRQALVKRQSRRKERGETQG